MKMKTRLIEDLKTRIWNARHQLETLKAFTPELSREVAEALKIKNAVILEALTEKLENLIDLLKP